MRACLAALSLGLAACSPAPSPAPNVILVLVDALRADRVGWAGGDRQLTPFLDDFASRATVFERAYSSSAWTGPSVASLFTSRFQSQHRVLHFRSVLAAEETTLAEILAANGYRTAAFSGNVAIAPHAGFDQGFGHFEVRPEKRTPLVKGSVEQINQAFLAWYDGLAPAERETPLFVYLHYMEPHTPYLAPEEILAEVLARRGSPEERRRAVQRASDAFWFQKEGAAPDWVAGLDAEQRQGIADLYDAEVAHVDRGLRHVFAALEARGVLSNAIVIVTADHGEELFDHGGYAHGHTLYEEVTRVPLAIRLPGQREARSVAQPVSLVDVSPTVLDLLSIAAPAGVEGRTLLPLLGERRSGWSWFSAAPRGRLEDTPIFSELFPLDRDKRSQPPKQAVVLGRRKLLVSPPAEVAGFDLAVDPGERNPQGLSPAERDDLRRELRQFNQRLGRASTAAGAGELDAGTRERLRALGYDE